MMHCSSLSLPQVQSANLNSILNTTAKSRRLGRGEMRYRRKLSRKLSHQLSVDNDILVAGQDLHDRVKQENTLIKTCSYLGRCYMVAFKGEELLHWMVSHCWAAHSAEALSICQLLLTHNVICNISDSRNLMSFKKHAIYRFRADQDQVPIEPSSGQMDVSLDMLYRKLWSDWVIRSRVIGWWLYTNTLTGEELLSWLIDTETCSDKEEARHFANQLLLVNFLIRIFPKIPAESERLLDGKAEEMNEEDSSTIYQINVCCNQTVDTTTKVFHTLAHAVRLCSVHSEECMFYGKSGVEEEIELQQFEFEESSPPQSLQSGPSSVNPDSVSEPDNCSPSLLADNDAKRFLQSVCRAYYPKFTSAIEETYYSYEVDPGHKMEDFTVPDEMFHSFQLSTFDQEDSIVIELEGGLNLQDLTDEGRSCHQLLDSDVTEEEDLVTCLEEFPMKSRSCTLDLLPTPKDSSMSFKTARLEINFEDIPSH